MRSLSARNSPPSRSRRHGFEHCELAQRLSMTFLSPRSHVFDNSWISSPLHLMRPSLLSVPYCFLCNVVYPPRTAPLLTHRHQPDGSLVSVVLFRRGSLVPLLTMRRQERPPVLTVTISESSRR